MMRERAKSKCATAARPGFFENLRKKKESCKSEREREKTFAISYPFSVHFSWEVMEKNPERTRPEMPTRLVSPA
jgi:hypothetical protein